MSLTGKQTRFVAEYLVDCNATQAAIRSGYSKKTAYSIGQRLLKNAEIAARLEKLRGGIADKLEITVERVLKERARLAFYNPQALFNEDGSAKAIHELDEDTAAVITGLDIVEMAGAAQIGGKIGVKHVPMHTKKIKLADKDKSLTALEKHLGMYNDDSNKSAPLNIFIHLGGD